jgi:eukaryotic-like serine/threonine-protein kinase
MTTERLSRDEFVATLDLSQLRGEEDGDATMKPTMAPRLRSPARLGLRRRLSRAFGGGGQGSQLQLLGPLAEGGMGVIYLAEQRSLKREVAVKTLKDEFLDEDFKHRLLREARITGVVEHPNIVPLYALEHDERDAPLLVMKRIEGESWRRFIRGEVDPPGLSRGDDRLAWHLSVLLEVCDAVHYAHNRGILHLDLKPDNVMIGGFRDVYLVDWGVACSFRDDHRGWLPMADEVTEVLGTPAYMPPEMVDPSSSELGIHSDVYLLGGLLYEILAKKPPHEGASIKDLLFAAYRARIGEIPSDAPPELTAIVRRAMAPEPTKRFGSAEAFRRAIADYLQHRSSAELAERSEKELEVIRDALARSDRAGPEAGPTPRLLRQFSECRFGFAQALREWPENERAGQGLIEATLLMAGYHIDNGEAASAESLLNELSEVPAPSRERVAMLRQGIELLRQDAARLSRMQEEQDDISTRRARAFYILIAAGAFNIPLLGGWLLGLLGFYSYESWHSLAFTSLLSGILAGVALVMRKHLMPNRASRRMVVAICVISVLMVLRRGLALAMGHEELRDMATDVFLFGSGCAVLATVTDRRLLIPGVAFILSAPFIVWLPEHTLFIVACATMGGVGSTAWMWLASDRRMRLRMQRERALKSRISLTPPV